MMFCDCFDMILNKHDQLTQAVRYSLIQVNCLAFLLNIQYVTTYQTAIVRLSLTEKRQFCSDKVIYHTIKK